MTTAVEIVAPTDTARAAARRMMQADVAFLPVCEGRQVVGVVCERDLVVRVLAEDHDPDVPVSEIMRRTFPVCRDKDDVRRAEELMGEHRTTHVVCVDQNDRLAGVVTLSKLAVRDDAARVARTLAEATSHTRR